MIIDGLIKCLKEYPPNTKINSGTIKLLIFLTLLSILEVMKEECYLYKEIEKIKK